MREKLFQHRFAPVPQTPTSAKVLLEWLCQEFVAKATPTKFKKPQLRGRVSDRDCESILFIPLFSKEGLGEI